MALEEAARRVVSPGSALCSVSVTTVARLPEGRLPPSQQHLLISRYQPGRVPLVAEIPLGQDDAPDLKVASLKPGPACVLPLRSPLSPSSMSSFTWLVPVISHVFCRISIGPVHVKSLHAWSRSASNEPTVQIMCIWLREYTSSPLFTYLYILSA